MSDESKAAFTPGPWLVYPRPTTHLIPDGSWEIETADGPHWVAHALKLEDARLIAAAPELLAALKAVLVMWNEGPCPRKLDKALTWRQNDDLASEMARSAIARAEGQS